MELVILGSGGGPQPNPSRSAPAMAIEHDGAVYVVDCGNGVARQLVSAGYRLRDLGGVLLTHHHIDHNADYGNLVALAWTAGLVDPVPAYGPTPMAQITDQYVAMNTIDVDHREALGRPKLRSLFDPQDVAGDGTVFSVDGLTVTAAAVEHPPLEAYGYRFETERGAIAVSGDTTYCQAMVELARGADVMVHEAFSPEHLHLLTRGTNTKVERLQQHFRQAHTTAEDAGRVAAEAGVKTLVLWHLIPTEGVTDDEWIAQARKHFDGEVLVSRDLLRVTV
ncbi:MBL fold metallo-hydrolase [Tomitella gaofuii]|uniref:MBL fold metallo-hydrolase n=1 Tax=Tomitella gaofuii TaxID=2760083 RepID=UPI0015FA33FA|nr:MBL fold metallo-hydrolase [Tomitella gaofuii]